MLLIAHFTLNTSESVAVLNLGEIMVCKRIIISLTYTGVCVYISFLMDFGAELYLLGVNCNSIITMWTPSGWLNIFRISAAIT